MNLTNKNGCVLVRRNFDRLIMKVFTNHLVVYVIEVTKIILNLFKYFKCIKSTKRKTSDFYPLRSLCAPRKKLSPLLLLLVSFCFISWFFVWVFLYAWNLFIKKKNNKINRFKIIFITSITYTTLTLSL